MSRCWAHNQDKVRCQLDAGHDQLHMFSITWSENDCYEPEKNITTSPLVIPEPKKQTPIPTLPPSEVSCVACSHKHRAGECKCGCKEFIG